MQSLVLLISEFLETISGNIALNNFSSNVFKTIPIHSLSFGATLDKPSLLEDEKHTSMQSQLYKAVSVVAPGNSTYDFFSEVL